MAARAGMLGVMPNDDASGHDLPDDLIACHELIRSLRRQNQDLRQKLARCEEKERQAIQHLYGPGASPASLLDFGLLMAGKQPLIRSGNPDDPTVGEVVAQERAERRRQRRQRRNDESASA